MSKEIMSMIVLNLFVFDCRKRQKIDLLESQVRNLSAVNTALTELRDVLQSGCKALSEASDAAIDSWLRSKKLLA
jgi:outer membrane murein-binding lipoprotein Lpp